MITTRTMTDDSLVILLNHIPDEKFERCENVRVVACGLYERLPDHRVRFCAARLPYDAINGLK